MILANNTGFDDCKAVRLHVPNQQFKRKSCTRRDTIERECSESKDKEN